MNLATLHATEACAAGGKGAAIAVDIASAKAVAIAKPLTETERLPLAEARGRILAQDVRASMDLPSFDNSAMDGYAVRRDYLQGEGPWTLSVAGRIAAGDAPPEAGERRGAIRIFTGAAVPEGCDAVVMQEHCERAGERIIIRERPRLGEHIRRAGEDVPAGTAILDKGALLTPQRLALLAGQGFSEVVVIRKVRIGLISTGTELRDPGDPLGPGQIYNSNRVMIGAMLAAMPWVEVVDYGIVPDSLAAVSDAFGQAASRCDVLVSTGGVSAGEEDYAVAALGRHGGRLDILKVAMRPGKPVKIGMIGRMLFAGLPGNPNAALVTFSQIALPAIRAIAGLASVAPDWSPAVAGFVYEKRAGRTEFVR